MSDEVGHVNIIDEFQMIGGVYLTLLAGYYAVLTIFPYLLAITQQKLTLYICYHLSAI